MYLLITFQGTKRNNCNFFFMKLHMNMCCILIGFTLSSLKLFPVKVLGLTAYNSTCSSSAEKQTLHPQETNQIVDTQTQTEVEHFGKEILSKRLLKHDGIDQLLSFSVENIQSC